MNKCPYCNKVIEDNYLKDDIEGDNFDCECPHCGEEFEVYVSWTPYFSIAKIEYLVCKECGEDFRYTGMSYPRPKKYKDEKCVCHSCYAKLVLEELNEKL